MSGAEKFLIAVGSLFLLAHFGGAFFVRWLDNRRLARLRKKIEALKKSRRPDRVEGEQ